MFLMVMDEFCHGEMFNPIKRCRGAVDAEIGF
jgi:hypothetical protein